MFSVEPSRLEGASSLDMLCDSCIAHIAVVPVPRNILSNIMRVFVHARRLTAAAPTPSKGAARMRIRALTWESPLQVQS